MRISAIIPTYNRRESVTRAIDSVLAQKRAADEVIVVDDGSNDGTCEELTARYANKIVLHKLTENRGVSAARNHAIKHSTGNWIALLDSDDEWLPGKLEQQESLLNQHPHVICHSDEIWIRNGVRVNQMKKHKKHGGDIYKQCLAMCAMSPSSALIEKNILLEAGGFDETLPACEDYDLWLKICARFPVLYIDKPLIRKYGGHDDQLSRQYWGMDRFRVQSLHNLINSNQLTDMQTKLATDTLLRKTEILNKGAIKHNNTALQVFCSAIRSHYC